MSKTYCDFDDSALRPIMLDMPWLFYRYTLSELLRVFLLTAVVLVTIIAFGATIKPLTSDRLLSAADIVKYLMLAMVPMLQFALPFAAGFASTIVLHRMTSENEVVAAAVSGISYRKMLAPIAALGVGLSIIMVGLTQYAIPQFWNLMERTIATDVTRLFQASIDRGVPFEAGGIRIFADRMWVVANPRDTAADTRLILSRVVAAELDSHGRIETDVTAQQAIVDIYQEENQTLIMLAMEETMQFDGGTGQLAYLPLVEPDRPIVVPRMLRDQLRAMTRSQLLRLRDDPDQYGPVREVRDELVQVIADRDLWHLLDSELQQHGYLRLARRDGSGRSYVIQGRNIHEGQIKPIEGDAVTVLQYDGTLPIRRITADRVAITRSGGGGLGHPAFELELLGCDVADLQSPDTVNRRERLVDSNLDLPDVDLDALPMHSSAQVLDEVRAMDSPSSAIQHGASRLEEEIVDLRNEVRARIQMRYAQSTTALLLLLLGATLSMVLRGTLPLVIYLWAFIPSILCLIVISGGDKMMRDGTLLGGFAVMWSGNIAMIAMFTFLYARLIRN